MKKIEKVLKILKEKGADFSIKDKRNKNALLYLSESIINSEILEYLKYWKFKYYNITLI